MDFGNTGGMRSPFSPRVRQSITGRRPTGLSSAKKNQNKFLSSPGQQTGEVIYKTPTSTVETYGLPLPVMVTETLTFASGEVTVRLSPCGWCWLVAGRRILAWPREHAAPAGVGSPAPAAPSAARELTLPQTDLAHKADLVVLFYENGSQMPSCIGVSPEGIVRYWPSVGQEGVYADVSAELAGQECERLGEYSQAGLVLATTTCTVVLLNPAVIDGRATVTCRTLRPPSGWLGGIGRRVSLLFFGSMPAHADTKLVGVVVIPDSGADGEECVALVAGGAGGGAAGGAGGGAAGGGPLLQLWRGAELHEHSLRRPLCDAHAQTLGQHAPGDLNSLEIIALDVRASGNNGLLLLIATVNVARSPEMRYAIARVCVQDASSPRVSSLCALRGWCAAAADAPPRFLPLGSRALLYTHNYLALVSSTVSNDKPDVIDVSSDGDRILGAELCDGVPLLFSKKHGVLALAAADGLASQSALCDSPMGSPCPSDMYDGNLSLYEIDPHEVSMVTTDACGKLKTAFLFHLRRDTAACRAILEELFPSPPPPSPPASSPASPSPPSPAEEERDVDALLDRTVLRIATEMLDDIPAGDPRWKPRGHGSAPASIALGSSAALQPAAQLRDKRRALALFVEFLRAAGLAARLGLVTSAESGGVVGTQWALGALAEQLAAALALRRLHQGSDAQLIEAAIYQVVCGGGEGGGGEGAEEEPGVQAALRAGALSPADVSYRRVSRTARVLRALARAPAPPDARAAAAHARDTLRVLTTVLSEMHRCRVQWQAQLQCAPPPAPALGPRALLPALVDLHRRALTEYGRHCPDATLRAQLCEAAAALADRALADAERTRDDDTHARRHYERMRADLIQPFVEEGQIERAAALAEKFKDFELLIEMCVNSNDMQRLYTYIDKYINEGMAETAFGWLCARDGRCAALLVRALGARYGARLRGWLAARGRRALLALQLLAAAHHAPAAAALADLAARERDSVGRMTTMASLAKLCAAAAAADEEAGGARRAAEARLWLAAQVAALPRALRLRHGLDADDVRVPAPEDLAQMYIESDIKTLTEYDYKKALDLTDYVEDMERRDDLRLRVWCASIKRDTWAAAAAAAAGDAGAPLLRDKVFFRLIDLVHLMGGDLELLLPPVEDILTAPELAELASDSQFHYLIKYGYECIDTTRNESAVAVEA